jgi:predicted dithiol-disulfide oxidoreductase (DUF899 family)
MSTAAMSVAIPSIDGGRNVVSEREWLEARLELLVKEKELRKHMDQVARSRQKLPWKRVEQNYVFQTAEGPKMLSELFEGRSQLMIYHFMFGPDWEQGCASCSFVADHMEGARVHLPQRDVTLLAVSRAPLAKIDAFKERMGWKFRWVSAANSSFNFDYHVSFTQEEMGRGRVEYNYACREFPQSEGPGLSVFYKDNGEVFHCYSTYGRGLDVLVGTYNYLDLVPKGRDEDGLEWPMAWVRHHDRYEGSPKVSECGCPE